MKHQAVWTALGVVGCGLTLSACAESAAAPAAEEGAAIVKPLSGGSELSKVTLVPKAAERLGIETTPVRETSGATAVKSSTSGAETVIPYGAVIYDPSGGTWAYTETGPLTYVRAEIVVQRIVGDRVLLRDGPVVGTPVVTVGATELYGAEVGVDH